MADKNSKTSRVAEIRRVNARFRKLKKRDGPVADRLMRLKDVLIDALQAECPHPAAIETPGSPSNGPFGLGGTPMRLCTSCGLVDQPSVPDGYKTFILMPETVAHDDFIVRQGLLLKRLGINL